MAVLQAWIFWAAMVVACVIYIIIGVMLHDASQPAAFPDLRWILLVLSAVQVLFAQIVMTPLLMRNVRQAEGEARKQAAMILVIIRSSFFEAIAIYGLILIIFNHRLIDGLIFSGLAIALLLTHRPQADHFKTSC